MVELWIGCSVFPTAGAVVVQLAAVEDVVAVGGSSSENFGCGGTECCCGCCSTGCGCHGLSVVLGVLERWSYAVACSFPLFLI